MPAVRSAGLLLFRERNHQVEVLLGHMGGPFWVRRDTGAWSIPKGEYVPPEEPAEAARREFAEELGVPAPTGELRDLGTVRQSGGKLVTIWAVAGDLDPDVIVPGTFEMEWPPRSGRTRQFPEVDRAEWFGLDLTHDKIVAGQRPFLNRLLEALRE